MVRVPSLERWIANRSPVDRLLVPDRKVDVWLPRSYSGNEAHPVLYVQDGQNAMDAQRSWTRRSWQLGHHITRLEALGIIPRPPIVVLLENVRSRRWMEYGDTPLGEAYLDFVWEGVKPHIDRSFRTDPSPGGTSVMGSSMGGLCAFLSLWKRPDVVGNCASLSPVFQAPLIADVGLHGADLRRQVAEGGAKIYIDNGGDSEVVSVPLFDPRDGWNQGYFWLDTTLQPGVDAMRAALALHRVPHFYHRAPGERHNEAGWARRLHLPLRCLFGGESPATP